MENLPAVRRCITLGAEAGCGLDRICWESLSTPSSSSSSRSITSSLLFFPFESAPAQPIFACSWGQLVLWCDGLVMKRGCVASRPQLPRKLHIWYGLRQMHIVSRSVCWVLFWDVLATSMAITTCALWVLWLLPDTALPRLLLALPLEAEAGLRRKALKVGCFPAFLPARHIITSTDVSGCDPVSPLSFQPVHCLRFLRSAQWSVSRLCSEYRCLWNTAEMVLESDEYRSKYLSHC